jgi:transposase
MIVAMKAGGQSIKAIAEERGIARSTVREILSRVAESGVAAVEISD